MQLKNHRTQTKNKSNCEINTNKKNDNIYDRLKIKFYIYEF
jgi:hypothetical protein